MNSWRHNEIVIFDHPHTLTEKLWNYEVRQIGFQYQFFHLLDRLSSPFLEFKKCLLSLAAVTQCIECWSPNQKVPVRSGSGHMSEMPARSPVGAMVEATDRCFPSLPLWKQIKWNFLREEMFVERVKKNVLTETCDGLTELTLVSYLAAIRAQENYYSKK